MPKKEENKISSKWSKAEGRAKLRIYLWDHVQFVNNSWFLPNFLHFIHFLNHAAIGNWNFWSFSCSKYLIFGHFHAVNWIFAYFHALRTFGLAPLAQFPDIRKGPPKLFSFERLIDTNKSLMKATIA